MENQMTRRAVVTGITAAALVTGLDPVTRLWVTKAEAATSPPTAPPNPVPPLDGTLLTDATARERAADDFGHMIHRSPLAVLRPGSVRDIATMLRYCCEHHIPVAARGQGHATHGQAQVEAGLVIDMTPLNTIQITGDTATVQAGALWSDLLRATLAQNLTPPVLTDYIELSIGGTLSVGGVGGATHHHGMQVDNVLELEVMTGTGDRKVCSPTANADLFHAVLAGLGQCAIITRATLRLLPAPTTVRRYQLLYPSVAALTADQRKVVRDGRFGYVEGQIVAPTESGGDWGFLLEAVAFHNGTTPPDNAALLGDLAYQRGTEQIDDLSYFDFANRLAEPVEFLKSIGEWSRPHPWWNGFLPSSAIDAFVGSFLTTLTPTDIGTSGVILLYPFRRAALQTPLLRVPDEELVFLFAVLKTASPGAATPDAMITANRTLYDQARAAGGHQYPVGSIPTTPADWRAHYGPAWNAFAAAKRRYDPAKLLAPGQGIFG
ncbi:FAD-binding protein [Thermopolyspora sp. NPDC052614]|uniref:FAD-binding protein n=1 Tax=Thermopolyspora sp. NPDC052614 TaxID=3155682 RepID=UPI0034153181